MKETNLIIFLVIFEEVIMSKFCPRQCINVVVHGSLNVLLRLPRYTRFLWECSGCLFINQLMQIKEQLTHIFRRGNRGCMKPRQANSSINEVGCRGFGDRTLEVCDKGLQCLSNCLCDLFNIPTIRS